ncbi:hypothetical protein [Streptomyces sp. NPDC005507]|uniref:hypothetical protein n=1 Tax=Streptomyces sp. NPDC005507 TaxID=3154885 RepID=UPI0033BF5DCB
MDWIIRAVRDNPEVFAALVALVAVFGGLAGSYIGAKIQAGSGRAQANAATDAAQIMVEYQHLATFHADRRAVLASYLSKTTAAIRSIGQVIDGEAQDMEAALDTLEVVHGELELVAPPDVVTAGRNLLQQVMEMYELAHNRAEGVAALRTVLGPSRRSGLGPEFFRARAALSEMVTAVERGADDDELAPLRAELAAALEDVGASSAEQFLILDEAELEEAHHGMSRHGRRAEEARQELVRAGRVMLGSDRQGISPSQ